MKKASWQKKIKKACEEAGTYRPFFDAVIETLAEILEKRDEAERVYVESGSEPIIVHVNKAGAANISKNPALVLWDDFNKSALNYWRDLGLTPKGLKAIDESAIKPQKKSGFAEVLKSLG